MVADAKYKYAETTAVPTDAQLALVDRQQYIYTDHIGQYYNHSGRYGRQGAAHDEMADAIHESTHCGAREPPELRF
jgi:hypothetical protein